MVRRAGLWLAAAVACAGFAFPYFAGLLTGASPLTIGNESIAYRFLYSERLLNGEGASIWFPAGFLTTAIQTTILAGMNRFIPSTPQALAERLDIYAGIYSGLVTAVGIAILIHAVRSRTQPVFRLAACALAAIGPIYLTRDIGFYYFTLPDYYHLNVLLCVGFVALFGKTWLEPDSRDGTRGSGWWAVLFPALIVGAATANKITHLPIGGTLVVAILLRPGWTIRRLLLEAVIATAGIATGFFFVMWWFYTFRINPLVEALGAWSRYVGNPGGESDFWQKFAQYLTSSSYGYIIGVYLVTFVTAAVITLRERENRIRSASVLLVSLCSCFVWAYFVYKRPAGTTFFEAISALLALTGFSVQMIAHRRSGRVVITMIAIISIVYGIQSFGWRKNIATLRESGPWARNMWQLHDNLRNFAAGRPIIIVHPQNHYGYGGVEEFLLKGATDMPTWNISANGTPILNRYLPNASFRQEYSGDGPDDPYPPGAVVFWVELPGFKPMTTLFPVLGAAVSQPGVEERTWPTETTGGRTKIIGRAFALPAAASNAAAETPQAVGGLSVSRDSSESATVTWSPAPTVRMELEFAAKGGDFMKLGVEPGRTGKHAIGSLTPGVDYVVRARAVSGQQSGPWLEVAIPRASAQ